MTAGALAAATIPVTKPFILTIGGRNVTALVPVGEEFPCRFSDVGEGSAGEMTFWLEDTTAAGTGYELRMGERVNLIDKRGANDRTLFGGHLVNAQIIKRNTAVGRLLQLTAVGHDQWLDWRIVPRFSTKADGSQATTIASDRVMVQTLISRFAGFLFAPDSTIDRTNASMEYVSVRDVTLREALTAVADTANGLLPEQSRHFFVDENRFLHYYRDGTVLPDAPYRIADGSYTRTVLATSGLVALWTLREASGTRAHESVSNRWGVFSGGYTRGVAGGIPNEPQMTATLLSTGFATVDSAAALHQGDTFSFECWFKRSSAGSIMQLWGADTTDLAIRFNSSDQLVIRKSGTSDVWTTNQSFGNLSNWHHLVCTKSGSTRAIYVDGQERNGSGTNATIVATATDLYIGAGFGGTNTFDGAMQHVALYSSAMSATTVLRHYNQGISITPEELTFELDATQGRESVYVNGGVADGTGWVDPGDGSNGISLNTAFGVDEPKRTESISRESSTTHPRRAAFGAAFLKANQDPVRGGNFVVLGYDGWQAGQLVYITDAAVFPNAPADGASFEIKQVDTDVLWGNGVLRYTVQYGKPIRSGARNIGRDQHKRRKR